MAQWTSFDFPPLPPHNPTRAPTHPTRPLTHPTRAPTHPTRPLTHPTRPPTQPTRPLTHPEPSILGNPPAHFGGSYRGGGVDGGRRGGPRGGGGGGRGGGRSHRGGRMGGRKVNDGYEGNFAGGKVSYDGNLCEKFDELEVIEESFELAKSLNYNGTDNSDGMINGRINGNVGVNDYGNVGVNVNGNDDDEKINGGNNDSFKVKYEDASDEIPVEASGQNVPKPVSNFGEITELGFALHENIKRCKYVKPTPIQRHAIPILMAGRDLMACAQTGSGKTAAFCFPIIAGILKRGPAYRPPGGGVGGGSGGGGGGFRGRGRVACPVALIMSPTRELSSQIHDEAKKFAHQTNVKVVVAYGGTPMSEQLYKLERGVDILVATPGRLVDMIERGRVSLRMVRYFALDEADRMLDMGFEPQIRKIAQQMDMPRTGARQTMLFSATFPTEIQRLASDFLSNYIFLTVGKVGSSNEMIEQKVELVDEYDKRKHLKDLLLAQEKLGLTIVFAETKRAVDSLAEWLSRNGFPATAIHGDKVQMERERALRSFKSGATPIIVATDVAARGLDIPCVAHVINYDLPRDIEHYVHRIGRTGRAGKSGLATAFFCDKDRPISKALAELMEEANQAVPSWLSEYARSSSNGYGGDSGGGRRNNRAGKFGGHDYRSFDHADLSNTYTDNNSSTHTEDYTRSYATEDYTRSYANEAPKAAYNEHYSSSYSNEVPKAAYTEDYTSTYEVPKAESFGGCGADSYASPAFGATRAYETIVATGWD